MKPRYSIVWAGVFGLLLLLLFWQRGYRDGISEIPNPDPIASNAIPMRPTASPSGLSASSSRREASATNEIGNQRINQQYQANVLDAKNVAFAFFGRFIDQHSNALSGVRIKLAARHWQISASRMGGSIRLEKVTDADGRFVVQGVTGDGFDIESVLKDGFELEPMMLSYPAVAGTPKDPVTFRMWRTDIHEKLITGRKAFPITPDGRPYVVNLSDGTIAESGPGDLTLSLKYATQVTVGKTYPWSCALAVVNGKLLAEPEASQAMYIAPIGDYVQRFHFEAEIIGGQLGDSGSRRFYLALNNGQEFGRIIIQFLAPYNNSIPGMFRLSYAINPSGSRILR